MSQLPVEPEEAVIVGPGRLQAVAVTGKTAMLGWRAALPALFDGFLELILRFHYAVNDVPHPQLFCALGFSKAKPEYMSDSL